MKPRHFFYGLVVLAICFSACKKDKEDFRDQWVGDWDFVIEKCTFNEKHEIVKRDMVYYSGKISYGEAGAGDNKYRSLYIQYIENYDALLYVGYSNGVYEIYEYCGLGSLCPRGQFEGDDKVKFYDNNYTEFRNIEGIKKKGDKK
jgi:hypothetical protein